VFLMPPALYLLTPHLPHVSAIGFLKTPNEGKLFLGHDGTKAFLKESCVFSQRGNNTEILCKAATIAQEHQSCHRYLGGLYYNLLSLAWGSRARHKKPCPVAAGSTTSLKNFLNDLHHVLQEEDTILIYTV
uniref:Uncharacterized protein n=1 Tax=Taeniopygia guttata TaxID=59729 RepID=H0YT16_TAEGU